MKILYAASEAVPFCKTGGLADVAGSLPPALAEQGAETAVILPLYRRIREKFADQLTFLCYDYVDLAWRHTYCGLFSMKKDDVTWYFLDNEQYFKREGGIYGYFDEAERFAFFSKAVLETLTHIDYEPDVIHCNDWQTALIPVYLNVFYREVPKLSRTHTVFTIHNIQYQGQFGLDVAGDVCGLPDWAIGKVEFHGDLNMMKGALEECERISTVSPTYAREILDPYFGHGLDEILRQKEWKLCGILNGIKRLHPRRAGTLRLAVFPLGVGLLDVGGVQQHALQQVGGEPGGEEAGGQGPVQGRPPAADAPAGRTRYPHPGHGKPPGKPQRV